MNLNVKCLNQLEKKIIMIYVQRVNCRLQALAPFVCADNAGTIGYASILLRRVLDIHCQIESSQCLAQLTPARVGKARSVHVQLGASRHVIR